MAAEKSYDLLSINYKENPRKPACMHAKLFQSCPTLCHPIDHSLSGTSAHGILQARMLEWVAIPFSRGSS